jgi:hypothetical protein
MDYIIVAFRARAHTVRFHEYLRRNGIYSEIVNTPKEAGVGCGLSVKVSKERLSMIKNIAYRSGLDSLAGFFIVQYNSGKRLVRSI